MHQPAVTIVILHDKPSPKLSGRNNNLSFCSCTCSCWSWLILAWVGWTWLHIAVHMCILSGSVFLMKPESWLGRVLLMIIAEEQEACGTSVNSPLAKRVMYLSSRLRLGSTLLPGEEWKRKLKKSAPTSPSMRAHVRYLEQAGHFGGAQGIGELFYYFHVYFQCPQTARLCSPRKAE